MRNSTKIAPRPRGRPRKFDRDTVLRAALQRFRTQGFANTSLDDLAEATGVNRPSLYAAFGDKKALYLAALARTREWLEASFDSLIAADLPLEQMLHALFLYAIQTYLSGEEGPSGCIAINTAATEAVRDPEIRTALADILTMEDAKIETLLRQAGSPAPAAHGRIVAAMLHSLSVRARAGESREAMTGLAREATALIAGSAEETRQSRA
jgi:TetR/AcrR family transcriptional regulator, copper-responsive repressor